MQEAAWDNAVSTLQGLESGLGLGDLMSTSLQDGLDGQGEEEDGPEQLELENGVTLTVVTAEEMAGDEGEGEEGEGGRKLTCRRLLVVVAALFVFPVVATFRLVLDLSVANLNAVTGTNDTATTPSPDLGSTTPDYAFCEFNPEAPACRDLYPERQASFYSSTPPPCWDNPESAGCLRDARRRRRRDVSVCDVMTWTPACRGIARVKVRAAKKKKKRAVTPLSQRRLLDSMWFQWQVGDFMQSFGFHRQDAGFEQSVGSASQGWSSEAESDQPEQRRVDTGGELRSHDQPEFLSRWDPLPKPSPDDSFPSPFSPPTPHQKMVTRTRRRSCKQLPESVGCGRKFSGLVSQPNRPPAHRLPHEVFESWKHRELLPGHDVNGVEKVYSAPLVKGLRGLLVSKGDMTPTVATKDRTPSVAKEDSGPLVAKGYTESLVAKGHRGPLVVKGDREPLVAKGYRKPVDAKGDTGFLVAKGDRAFTVANGDRGPLVAKGDRGRSKRSAESDPEEGSQPAENAFVVVADTYDLVNGLCGIVSGVLITVFNYRWTSVAGALMSGVAVVIASVVSPSPPLLAFLLGALPGIGNNLLMTSMTVALLETFPGRRLRVLSLSYASLFLSHVAFTLVQMYLFPEIGVDAQDWRSVLQYQAATYVTCLAGALVVTPLNLHMRDDPGESARGRILDISGLEMLRRTPTYILAAVFLTDSVGSDLPSDNIDDAAPIPIVNLLLFIVIAAGSLLGSLFSCCIPHSRLTLLPSLVLLAVLGLLSAALTFTVDLFDILEYVLAYCLSYGVLLGLRAPVLVHVVPLVLGEDHLGLAVGLTDFASGLGGIIGTESAAAIMSDYNRADAVFYLAGSALLLSSFACCVLIHREVKVNCQRSLTPEPDQQNGGPESSGTSGSFKLFTVSETQLMTPKTDGHTQPPAP